MEEAASPLDSPRQSKPSRNPTRIRGSDPSQMPSPPTRASVAQFALATHEATSGPNHAWTKDSACVTADALDALGRAEEAKALILGGTLRGLVG